SRATCIGRCSANEAKRRPSSVSPGSMTDSHFRRPGEKAALQDHATAVDSHRESHSWRVRMYTRSRFEEHRNVPRTGAKTVNPNNLVAPTGSDSAWTFVIEEFVPLASVVARLRRACYPRSRLGESALRAVLCGRSSNGPTQCVVAGETARPYCL